MGRKLALPIYVLGTLFALTELVEGRFIHALIYWWLTVGLGWRLGVTPIEFVREIPSLLGFTDDDPEPPHDGGLPLRRKRNRAA